MIQQIGVIVVVVCCAVMHVLQPERSVLDDAVSYYKNRNGGRILSFGLIAIGAGSVKLAWRSRAVSRGGAMLLAALGIGCILGGIFRQDPRGSWHQPPSFSGIMHNGAALIAFLAFPASALTLFPRCGRLLSQLVTGVPPHSAHPLRIDRTDRLG